MATVDDNDNRQGVVERTEDAGQPFGGARIRRDDHFNSCVKTAIGYFLMGRLGWSQVWIYLPGGVAVPIREDCQLGGEGFPVDVFTRGGKAKNVWVCFFSRRQQRQWTRVFAEYTTTLTSPAMWSVYTGGSDNCGHGQGRMETFHDEATLGKGTCHTEKYCVGSCLSLRHMPTEGAEIVCKAWRWRQKV